MKLPQEVEILRRAAAVTAELETAARLIAGTPSAGASYEATWKEVPIGSSPVVSLRSSWARIASKRLTVSTG